MDYYRNAKDNERIARMAYDDGTYQVAISLNVFSKQFCEEFLSRLDDVKDYVDNYCIPDLKDLQNKFKK